MSKLIPRQVGLFEGSAPGVSSRDASTFVPNMKLPVHRWFRFSAGFSGEWAEGLIEKKTAAGKRTVLDPFCGSGTTLIAAECAGAAAYGVESHPFLHRIARSKLLYRTSADDYLSFARRVRSQAIAMRGSVSRYSPLIRKCFSEEALCGLDTLRTAWENGRENSPSSELVWLTIVSMLRSVSHVGTAPWQYVLPKKTKQNPLGPFHAFDQAVQMFSADMRIGAKHSSSSAQLILSDARTCAGVPDESIDLVITSPPYPNNFDYADATRLEMTFMGEIGGWGDLQQAVRTHLIRSCSQHVPQGSVDLEEILSSPELDPIRGPLTEVCQELARVREEHGGKKTYHLMVACYFLDMARMWTALRRVCRRDAALCFVIGDSAPYGVHVPVMTWLAELAIHAGFRSPSFEKTRDRNVKWKNRKHRIPLQEGWLSLEG